jgi:hypothetical protein
MIASDAYWTAPQPLGPNTAPAQPGLAEKALNLGRYFRDTADMSRLESMVDLALALGAGCIGAEPVERGQWAPEAQIGTNSLVKLVYDRRAVVHPRGLLALETRSNIALLPEVFDFDRRASVMVEPGAYLGGLAVAELPGDDGKARFVDRLVLYGWKLDNGRLLAVSAQADPTCRTGSKTSGSTSLPHQRVGDAFCDGKKRTRLVAAQLLHATTDAWTPPQEPGSRKGIRRQETVQRLKPLAITG